MARSAPSNTAQRRAGRPRHSWRSSSASAWVDPRSTQLGDGRFRDQAWSENPLYSRVAKTYLAFCRSAENLVTNLEEKAVPEAPTIRFVATIATSALAPTNTLLLNPEALKRAFDTGGKSLVQGGTNWLSDVQKNGGMPATAKRGQFTLGQDLASTPGAVVSRDALAELIQYAPATETVHQRPTLVVPPPIGKFYFLDLAPGRSFIEHAVGQGIQTFTLSWRNPTREHAGWGVDAYARRVLAAVDEVRAITGQDQIDVIGFCAGGIVATVALNELAASGKEKVATASYGVTLLDWGGDNPINVFRSRAVRRLGRWSSRRKGVIDARTMGGAFTWMRPDDLIWKYWVNNYLLGQDPPAFDILAWNADGTNLPATLHKEFLDIFGNNPLPTKCSRQYLSAPVDLGNIKLPTFVVGAVNDHLTPWRGTYRTTELLGGESTFVLSNAGHIAALVNPPTSRKASYFVGPKSGEVNASAWRAGAVERQGSWWTEWADWTRARAGELVPAPAELGSEEYPVLGSAPGEYVLAGV
jgi:polyhydroxyalkanoate synthase